MKSRRHNFHGQFDCHRLSSVTINWYWLLSTISDCHRLSSEIFDRHRLSSVAVGLFSIFVGPLRSISVVFGYLRLHSIVLDYLQFFSLTFDRPWLINNFFGSLAWFKLCILCLQVWWPFSSFGYISDSVLNRCIFEAGFQKREGNPSGWHRCTS